MGNTILVVIHGAFWGGDGIAQPLFSTFKLIAKLESTCRPNCKETLLKEYV